MDKAQLAAAVAAQVLIAGILGTAILKSFMMMKTYKLTQGSSTLFYEFPANSRIGVLFYPVTILIRGLMAFVIVFFPNASARYVGVLVLQLAVSYFILIFSTSSM